MSAAAAALGAAALLPYTLLVSGRAAFDSNAGLGACLLEAQAELRRSYLVLSRDCERDGGLLSAGAPQETLVQGVQCEASVRLFCAPAKAGARSEIPQRTDSSSPKA